MSGDESDGKRILRERRKSSYEEYFGRDRSSQSSISKRTLETIDENSVTQKTKNKLQARRSRSVNSKNEHVSTDSSHRADPNFNPESYSEDSSVGILFSNKQIVRSRSEEQHTE